MFLLCVERIATRAIGTVGGDLYLFEFAIATVFIVAAKAHVALDGMVYFVHNVLLYINPIVVCANHKNNTIDNERKIKYN